MPSTTLLKKLFFLLKNLGWSVRFVYLCSPNEKRSINDPIVRLKAVWEYFFKFLSF